MFQLKKLRNIKKLTEYLESNVFDKRVPFLYIVCVDKHMNVIDIIQMPDKDLINLPVPLKYYLIERTLSSEYIFRCVNKPLN